MHFKVAQTSEDISICYKLREIIFIRGQNVPVDRERDVDDNLATHFLLYDIDNNPIGVGRVVANSEGAIIGRLGILEGNRGNGAGLFLMKNIIDYCKKQGFLQIVLGAQEHAIAFYKKLGFEVIGESYIDANISHFKMQFIF